MPNHLANETSPYLLQHAHNPVDWWPWCAEALDLARSNNRPILLSIGYAACHWCHVMERESFENDAIAAQMNAGFVCIKVDREERPDIDAIYMQATQAMTGHGGWPMTVFLTPAGEPFFAGTYYPPEDRQGMPGFRKVLAGVADAWVNRQENVVRATAGMRELYAASRAHVIRSGTLGEPLLQRATSALHRRYEPRYGGFDGAPKFPPSMALDYLLRDWARTGNAKSLDIVSHTFRAMSRGGIYDQIGGGFSRYSVDAFWLVPHFEKMLYDNALLLRLGAHLFQATRSLEVERVVRQTLDWLAREMTSPDGGFYSSLDADSEGHEGKFYVWSSERFRTLLGEEADVLAALWGVSEGGNFEGDNILNVARDPNDVANEFGMTRAELDVAIERAIRILMAERDTRVRPGRDDKILAAWNGFMLRACAECARVFGEAGMRDVAIRNGELLFRELVHDGRVLRSFKDGQARIAGYLEDHAAVALGAVSLYQLTFERKWLDRARLIADDILSRFWDDDRGAFFDTASDAEQLVTRPRDATDNAIPSGNSLTAELLLILADFVDEDLYRARALSILESIAEPMAQYPTAFGHALGAADMAARGSVQLVITGNVRDERAAALYHVAADTYVPSLILAGGTESDTLALMRGRTGSEPRAFVCQHYSCRAPVGDPDLLSDGLIAARRPL